jgi:hypothetical protein
MFLLLFISKSKSTVYELFSSKEILDNIPHKTLHFTVNGQGMDMFIGKQDDDGALLIMARNNKYLPFYRDKNGGIAVHFYGSLDRQKIPSPGTLMSMIEPLIGFVNNSSHSTKYVSLRLDKGFDANRFIDQSIHDSEDLPVYPTSLKVNTIQTAKFSIGHYKVQATKGAVALYYDSRLKSEGYKKMQEKDGLTLYQAGTRLFLLNVEEKESGYVSIITYTIKNK